MQVRRKRQKKTSTPENFLWRLNLCFGFGNSLAGGIGKGDRPAAVFSQQ
ncbi:MAG: hypothetical protein HC942_30265 [Microcoleus sp. SU_5_6]|nr:hypothetical protein [Microcoleus sp. SU_5_6]